MEKYNIILNCDMCINTVAKAPVKVFYNIHLRITLYV